MFFQQRRPQCFQNNPQASFNRTSSNMQASSRLLSAMEPRTAGSAPAAGLKITDDQIDAIISKHLPLTPHLLSVPTTAPYPHEFPYENKNTSAARLFDPWEVKQLQYMTLVSHGDRGVGLAQGNWEDEINALSPHSMGLRSSTTTPNPHKERKNKISLTDYKKVLKGEMVMPKKSASPPAVKKPEEPRRVDKPAPINSIKGTDSGKPRAAVVENKRNGLGPAAQGNKPELKPPGRDHKGHSESQPTRSEPKGSDKAPPRTNGHLDRPAGLPPKPKDITAARPSPKSDSIQKSKEPAKQVASSRPQPSSTNLWDMKKKRPLDSPARDALHPEKRTKTENGHARTPSGSLNPTPGRVGTPSDSKASPFKHGHSRSASNLSRVSPSQSLPQSKKAASKASDSRPQSSKPSPQKPVNSVPPLLSPLHPDLGGSDSVAFFASAHLQSDDRTPPKTPKKLAGNSTQKPSTNDSPLSSPLSTPPKSQQSFNNLPPPLSPMLPDILEQELAKLQQKSAQASILTVEARHEKARLPDTPGVARKTVKAKVGHPPKKERTSDVSQKSRDLTEKELSYIVKLQYKKRRAKDIERILTLPAKPSKEFKRYEAQRLEAERERREPTTKTAFGQDSSDDDTPIATVAKKTVAKKRPSTEHVDPPPKRMKVPENVDASKAPAQVTPAFKSPGPNGPPQKSLLATPKKGDAMKGVLGGAAMRKVDSSDGHAHTPQTISTSTPASAEKPRVANGDQRVRYDEIGLKLKRKMDVILRTKEPGGMDKISDQERKLGACVGLECVSAYMLNAYQATRNEKQLGRPRQSVQWEQVFALWLFLDKVCRDTKSVLHALAVQIGAVCIDHLHSIHLERKDPKAFDSGKRREELWLSAHRMRGSLSELGPTRGVVLGPWSSVQEATNYAYGVIGAFAKKEKLEWKKED